MMSGKQLSLDSRIDMFLGLNQMKNLRAIPEPPTVPIIEANESVSNGKNEEEQRNRLTVPIVTTSTRPRSKSVDNSQRNLCVTDNNKTVCFKCGHEKQFND